MTDKEKASDIYDICLEKNRFIAIGKMGEETCSKCKTYKMYKLGLAEGKPKWHEIDNHVKPSREVEKKYMPKSRQKVMLKYHFYGDDEIHYSDGYYDCYDFEFHIPNNPMGKIICVIAWCEISKFKE